MKIYKVSFNDEMNESHGYSFFSSKKEAEKAIKIFDRESNSEEESNCEITEIITEISGKAIIELLNQHGDHPDNG